MQNTDLRTLPFVKTMPFDAWKAGVSHLWRESTLQRIALTAIVALAAVLRFANLGALGLANHYYTAAVASMLQSWHNFFFAAAEPGGSVSIDKPPVGLWLQTISAYFLGVNGFAVLLPQILAGILSVVVVYHLVRRSFGAVAGLLAALALAITPVVIATDLNNTIDSTLILTLLLAAWAFVKATENGRLRYLLLGAALVGIGFNIKMLEAFLPLPAFYALYLLGSSQRLLRKLANLSLATVLLLAVSLSWAVAVDLTPADQRPYVGSSGDNSVMSLIVGYNGMERLLGMGGMGGGPVGGRQGAPQGQPAQGASGAFPGQGANAGGLPAQLGNGNGGAGGGRPALGQGGPGGGGGGFMGTGQAGALRLFSTPLSKEVSWLLPFGLFSIVLLAARSRLHWPISPKHQAMVLWGGWLLTGAVFFSVAGFFHQYYLSMLAAPLAALVGIGVVELWRLRGRHPWLATALLVATAGGTLGLQIVTATAFVRTIWWLPLAIGLFVVGAGLSISAGLRQLNRYAVVGVACVVGSLLITPGIWSGLTTASASQNQSLPAAYGGESGGPANGGGLQVNQSLLDYLQANTQGMKYLMAVPSSMQGSDYVLATGRPVLILGGFMGQDKVASADDLAHMVANGELRYIYWSGNGGGGPGAMQSDVSTWVANSCQAVSGFDTATQNSGAPDGTTVGQDDAQSRGQGDMQVSLYDCSVAK